MSIKFTIYDTVRAVKQHAARQWIRGVGKDTEFQEGTAGWYVTIGDLSIYVGEEKPEMRAGDRVRLTVEKV